MTRPALAAFGCLSLALFARAGESSSPRYINISIGGAQATISAPAPARIAPAKRLAAAAAPQAPAPAAAPAPVPVPSGKPGVPLFASLAALLAGGGAFLALRRRAGARRRVQDETVALAAHEMQSPLAAIESYLDLMASEAPAAGEEARRWLEDLSCMRTTTSHLRRTITDILDMTRVEDGRMKLSARPVDPGELARESVAAYAAHAAARGVALSAPVPAGLAPVLADPDRLRQVLDNLIGNALKYTPSGRGVRVEARESGTALILEVSDEGVGVPAERRARLFGKFQRLGPAVDGTEGTGLGLYLSRRLVEAQGGRLEHEPGREGGSIFRVTLPRA